MAMDWEGATERYSEALKRIVAVMVAMVGATGAFTSPLRGFKADPPIDAVARSSAEKAHKGEVDSARPTLPRHLYRAVLRILHPAESAARRLIVVAARGLVVPPPRLGVPKPPKREPSPTGIVFPYGARNSARFGAQLVAARPAATRAAPARICLPLCDTLRPPSRRPRCVPARDAPRITLPGITVRHRLPPKPTPFDPIDATRLRLRLAALQTVLDDLPRQALRFARWRARRDARLGRAAESRALGPDRGQDGGPRRGAASRPAAYDPRRVVRLSPLRPGRPPGLRRRNRREVHEVLNDLQQLAWWTLEPPDTS